VLTDPRSTDANASACLPSRAVGDFVASVTLPRPELVGVARLVVGGAAARTSLALEDVDDLQLAIEAVVRAAFETASEVEVRIESSADTLEAVVRPLPEARLSRRYGGQSFELRTLLERLVDRVTPRSAPGPALVLAVDLPAAPRP
jgi:hypothetical protein